VCNEIYQLGWSRSVRRIAEHILILGGGLIMSQITVNDLTFSYNTVYDNVFEHASFQIDTDWKLGFIGRNGKGKTTFLNLLMGKYEYQGSIIASVDFDYFPFEVTDATRNTIEIIKNKIAPYYVWEEEMQAILDEQEVQLDRYGKLLDLYQAHDGYIIDELIEKELGKLQVDPSVLVRPFSTLSFGERTKVMLAALFLKKNNFLLIDEPTNHLDLEGRETLAGYLQAKQGFILVSHDRAFLDQCIDHVLSINRANIEVVKGNFTSWRQNKELKDQYELEKNEQLKKDITLLSEAAKRAMGWSDQVEASKIGTHAADRGAIGHKAAKMMKRAKSIENRKLDAIEDKKSLLKNVELMDALKMNVMDFPKKRFIEAEDLSLFYDGRTVASGLDFVLQEGDRLAIKGRNGSGKTTLLRLLLGEDITYTGRYKVAQGLKISYVSQDTSYLTGNLKDFAVRYGLDETIFKTVLRQLDFSRIQFEKDIRDFSGGQKKKVLLAKSLAEPAHLFLWDEPLNFIDVFSRIQIEDLLVKYQPTMIFVEHDKIFSEKVANKILSLS
jgi:lincosamide and streptogramin A transport system ATP-binding/permease protein